ncbi:MAG: PD40 domain-containing protein, partial [Planctomycetes bacterium]|nr:PD40 domain-containing protein [Planctomycetota bacterium]
MTDEELWHASPYALPGGHFVLFTAVGSLSGEGVAIAAYSHESGETTTILEGAWNPKYVPTGHLVYEIPGGLMAAPFDIDRLEFTGPVVPVGEDRMVKFNTIIPAEFAISASGSFAHVVGSGDTINFLGRLRSLVWVDRNGNETLLDTPPKFYDSPRLSPDGGYLAISIEDFDSDSFDPFGRSDISVYDLERNTWSLLTFDNEIKTAPVWTPDGARVVFASGGSAVGPSLLKWKSADGTGVAERLVTNSSTPLENSIPNAWTPDGQGLVIQEFGSGGNTDLLLFAPESGEEPRKLTDTPHSERRARISPDGRWIAYVSNSSNQDEVYVQRFPQMDGMWQISTDGGKDPIWSPDGSELFYRKREAVIAVPVETEPVFRAGTPEVLFEGKYLGFDRNIRPSYDLAPD